MKKNKDLLLDINDRPKPLNWLMLSIQHIFAMFGATILVPILVNNAAGSEILSIPVALISSGIGTLIYIVCTKGKSPVYLGSSFAFITPIIVACGLGGKASVFTAIMAVGLVYFIVSLIIRLVGKKWINKLLPPIVVGPMIMIIGLSLAPTAVEEIGLNLEVVPWKALVVAAVSFITTAILAVRGKGIFKVIPFLIGMVAGYISALCLGMIDFAPVSSAKILEVPNFYIPFLHYKLNFAAILTIVPIALVTMAEHIGDHKVLSEIVGRDLIEDPGLDKTLMGDGLATLAAGVIGGPPNTTYGENTSVVGMTKVASVWVTGLAAVIAIIIGFVGKLTSVISTIPNAVLGGVAVLLYGFIAVNGLKVLIQNKVDFKNTKNIVIASTMLVLGLGGAAISINSGNMMISISGMSLSAIIGIVLNLVLPEEK